LDIFGGLPDARQVGWLCGHTEIANQEAITIRRLLKRGRLAAITSASDVLMQTDFSTQPE